MHDFCFWRRAASGWLRCRAAMRTGLSAQTCNATATCSGRQSCWPTPKCQTQPAACVGLSRAGGLCAEPASACHAQPVLRRRSCSRARRAHVQAAIAEPPAALVEQESFPRGAHWQARLLSLFTPLAITHPLWRSGACWALQPCQHTLIPALPHWLLLATAETEMRNHSSAIEKHRHCSRVQDSLARALPH